MVHGHAWGAVGDGLGSGLGSVLGGGALNSVLSGGADSLAPAPRPQLTLVSDELAAADGVDDQWQEKALCAQTDPEAFFPEKGGSTREAKRICLGCEVRDACLEYALAHDERFGIWGGLSERERRRLKRGVI